MKSPHELDERVVAAKSVGPRAVEGHHQECPRRPPPRWIRRNDTREAKIACRHLKEGGRTDALEWLGFRRLRQGPKCTSTSRERNPSRYSGPQLKVGPEVFGKVLPRAHGGTVGEGDKFLRLDLQKRTLPSSSLKQKRVSDTDINFESISLRFDFFSCWLDDSLSLGNETCSSHSANSST
ncbi:hypothetical protein GOBAR_AA22009 [Gossypium barbadense]|uniref:Uncharacterized protein n=1 Tax=Gossypium barbadense TaxID=3634 RepID=A0A2P5X5Q4_GOSBA|nr:hypothetical protein GOBAR_AA22009 [Gossypium barbadense]